MQLVVVLFSKNPVECWLDFNPLHCEIMHIRLRGTISCNVCSREKRVMNTFIRHEVRYND